MPVHPAFKKAVSVARMSLCTIVFWSVFLIWIVIEDGPKSGAIITYSAAYFIVAAPVYFLLYGLLTALLSKKVIFPHAVLLITTIVCLSIWFAVLKTFSDPKGIFVVALFFTLISLIPAGIVRFIQLQVKRMKNRHTAQPIKDD